MEILVVNAQPLWLARIEERLKSTGARVWTAADWNSGEELLQQAWPDVVVVEERLLERQGLALLTSLRRREWPPIIVPTVFEYLSADDAQVSVRGEQALGRLVAMVTRLQGVFAPGARALIRVGRLTVDVSRKEAVFGARRVALPPQQYRLLVYLALNAGRVVEHAELLREVWGFSGPESEARELIKSHVRALRHKLGWTDPEDGYLKSVRGFGYMLNPPRRASRAKRTRKSDSEPS
jgi:two-component system KDP operon response regulator KdpE